MSFFTLSGNKLAATLIAAGALVVTGTGVAVSEDQQEVLALRNETLRSQAEGAISSIIRSFSPPAPGTPVPTTTPPASPPSASLSPEAPKPLPAIVHSPAGTPPAAAVPAAPAPAQNRAEPSVRERQGVEPRRNVTQAPQNHGTGTPSTGLYSEGKLAAPHASRPANVPSWADKTAAGRADVRADGKAKGKAGADGGTGQGAGQPTMAPPRENQR